MRDYPQIVAQIKNSLWLIEKNSLVTILDIVNRRLSGDALDAEEIRLRIEEADNGNRNGSKAEVAGGIGIVPIYGPIFPKANIMTELSGATSLESFRSDLRALVENDKVKSIVLDMDTPGGVAQMVEETANEILAARKIKPVYAVANGQCCSAGHWLASSATKFYSTLSGEVGSIGVYTVHEDFSKQNEQDGVKVTVLTAGEYKAAGNPHEPLSEKDREYIQETIDEVYENFLQGVATGRKTSVDTVRGYADGRVFSGRKALEAGMIDGVKTIDSVVDGLLAENHAPVVRSTLVSAMERAHPRLEHADLEHSEPGTGSPPERRKDGDIEEDEMYRREQVPPAFEEPEELVMNGGINMEEFLTQLRERLGLSSDATEDDVLALVVSSSSVASELGLNADATTDDILGAIREQNAQLEPLREAEANAHTRRAFREQFPDEYARMENLEETDRENKAKVFADNFSRFVVLAKDGGATDERSTRGFSSLVIADVEQAHLDISKGVFNHAGLDNLLTHIANNGIVDFSESGSSRHTSSGMVAGSDDPNPRKRFMALAEEIMEEDGLELPAAVRIAAERDPELFEQYRDPHINKSA